MKNVDLSLPLRRAKKRWRMWLGLLERLMLDCPNEKINKILDDSRGFTKDNLIWALACNFTANFRLSPWKDLVEALSKKTEDELMELLFRFLPLKYSAYCEKGHGWISSGTKVFLESESKKIVLLSENKEKRILDVSLEIHSDFSTHIVLSEWWTTVNKIIDWEIFSA